MRPHARSAVVHKAHFEVTGFLWGLVERKQLSTYGEMITCLSDRIHVLTHRGESVTAALTEAPVAPVADGRALTVWCVELRRIQAVHDLTYGEWLQILGSEIAGISKYLIRHERHPDDPEKQGDEA